MAGSSTQFERFLQEEVEKYRGVSVPLRAGLLERALVRRVNIKKLHPNPGDEFCMPEIGPNFEIISRYCQAIRSTKDHGAPQIFTEPLSVEKMSPDGYMILNGHHRWAACLRSGIDKVRIEIVNATHEADIRSMLQATDNHRRVTLDLDEVVFRPQGDKAVEKRRLFALRPLERKPIRLGIPALFRFLTANGYDVWVYTKHYYSLDDVEHCFEKRRAGVTGVVTGTGRKTMKNLAPGDRAENLIADKYDVTIHIDNDMLLKTSRKTGGFEEFPLKGTAGDWSREIMDIIQGMKE